MVVVGVAEAAVAEVVVALVFVAETAITGMAAAVGGGLAGLTVRVAAVGEVVISTRREGGLGRIPTQKASPCPLVSELLCWPH